MENHQVIGRSDLPYVATVLARQDGQHLGKKITLDQSTGKYQKHPVPDTALEYKVHEFRSVGGLQARYELRKILLDPVNAGSSLISGSPGERIISEMSEVPDVALGSTHLCSGVNFTASKDLYVDEPRSCIPFDLDGLLAKRVYPDFNARHCDMVDLNEIIEQFLKEIDADFLIANYVMQLSSGHGLYDQETIRAHIDFILDKPMTLERQARLATYLNKNASEAGFLRKDPETGIEQVLFDYRIYRPNSFIFTSRARIGFDPTGHNFREAAESEIERFDPEFPKFAALARLHHHTGGAPLVVIPDGVERSLDQIVAPEIIGAPSRARRSHSRLAVASNDNEEKLSRAQRVTRLAPGDIHDRVVGIIGSVASMRSDRAEWALEHYRQASAEWIKGMPGDEAKLNERLRTHTKAETWRKEYRSARASFMRRNQWIEIRSAEETRGVLMSTSALTTNAGRGKLERCFEDFRDEAFKFNDSTAFKRPPLLLVKAPTGIGKSYAKSRSLPPEKIVGKYIATLLPTDALAEEVHKDREQEWAPLIIASNARDESDGEESQETLKSHLRWLRGRRKLCNADARTKRAAEALERAGFSPSGVCNGCKLRDTCEYFNSPRTLAADTILQHAHTQNLLRPRSKDNRRLDAFYIDESILPLLLTPQHEAILPVDDVRAALSGGVVRRRIKRENLPKIGELKGEARKAAQEARRKAIEARKLAAGKPAIVGNGAVSLFATADLRAVGAELLAIFDATAGEYIKVDQLAALKVRKIVRGSDGAEREMRHVEVMEGVIWTWVNALRVHIGDLALALAAQHGKGVMAVRAEHERDIDETQAALDVAMLMAETLCAIRCTLDIPARDEVMAVRFLQVNGKRCLRANVRNKLPKMMQTAPGCLIDGTLDTQLTKDLTRGTSHVVSECEMNVRPPDGAYHLVQIPERPFGKSCLVTKDEKTGEVVPTGLLWDLWRLIWVEATRWRGRGKCTINKRHYDGYVGVQLDVEKALVKMGMPPNVYMLHFGNERGVNKLKGTKFCIIAGRPMPKVREILDMTEALHADNPAVLKIQGDCDLPAKGERHDRGRHRRILPMADGRSVAFPMETLADPDANRIMLQQIDAPVSQMAGRGRIFDKDTSDPFVMYVFGQADLKLEIHEAVTVRDVARDAMDLMLAAESVFDRQDLAERFCAWARSGRREWVRGTGGGTAFAEQLACFVRSVNSRLFGLNSRRQIRPLSYSHLIIVSIYTGRSNLDSKIFFARSSLPVRFTSPLNSRPATCWLNLRRHRMPAQWLARVLDTEDSSSSSRLHRTANAAAHDGGT